MSEYADVAAQATDNFGGDTAPAPTPEPSAPPAPTPPQPPQPDQPEVEQPGEAWTGPSQDEWSAFQERQAWLEQQLQEGPPTPQFDPYTGQPLDPAQQQPELPEAWDPDYSAKMQEYLDWRDQQVIDRAMGGVQPFVDTAISEQAQTAMHDALTGLTGEDGVEGFSEPYFKAAELVGNGFLGETGGDPYAALRKGAEFVTQMVKAERDAAVTAYKESLARGNGHQEPAAGASAGLSAPGPAGSYAEIAEMFASDPGRPERAFN